MDIYDKGVLFLCAGIYMYIYIYIHTHTHTYPTTLTWIKFDKANFSTNNTYFELRFLSPKLVA